MGKIEHNISRGMGNTCKVGVYEFKVCGEFKNGSSVFWGDLGSGHRIIHVI
jgi:hypothetical protein